MRKSVKRRTDLALSRRPDLLQRTCRMVLVIFYLLFLKIFFHFVVAIFELVHAVEVKLACVNCCHPEIFSEILSSVHCSFTYITHVPKKISRCC